jgi:hypothetical protein
MAMCGIAEIDSQRSGAPWPHYGDTVVLVTKRK